MSAARRADAAAGEIRGLLALMLLHDARRAGRQTAGGDIVLLESRIARCGTRCQSPKDCGLGWKRRCGCRAGPRLTRYRPRSPLFMRGAQPNTTNGTPTGRRSAGLYEVLLRISPSPVIGSITPRQFRWSNGPARALDLIDALEARGRLKGYD